MSDKLSVTMLGSFSVRMGENLLDEGSNRQKKVWLLLAYIIYARNYRATQENYLSVIRGADTEDTEDPAGRLKALFYRARTMLNQCYENAGHDLIVHKNGTYAWNTEIPMHLDIDEFDVLCAEITPDMSAEEQLRRYRRAIELYRGDFLPKLAMEHWVMPIHTYYHQKYLDVVQNALLLLEEGKMWEEGIRIAEIALQIEPYSEAIYQHLMRCRFGIGDKSGVMAAYEKMSEILFDTFGVMPSDESRRLYREASRMTSNTHVPIGTVREQLREEDEITGAMSCAYDFFRFLYQVQARAVVRTGDVIHIGLFTLHKREGEKGELSRRSLDRAMKNFESILLGGLRRGDVVSQCSVSQQIVMLPQANYENSIAVCRRLVKSFERQYPHTPIHITFSVQPLEPQLPQ